MTAAAWAVYGMTILGYRSAMFRERGAGYTTLRSADAALVLPGKPSQIRLRLFWTQDLWQLDPTTGAVLRRPGQPAGPQRDQASIDREERWIEATMVGCAELIMLGGVVAVVALVGWAVLLR